MSEELQKYMRNNREKLEKAEKENKELIATIELGYKEETKLIKEIQSLRKKSLEQIKLLADMQDTNETIATAYEDEKKINIIF